MWQDVVLAFIGGWVAHGVSHHVLRAYRQGRNLGDAVVPGRAERRAARVPRTTEVGY